MHMRFGRGMRRGVLLRKRRYRRAELSVHAEAPCQRCVQYRQRMFERRVFGGSSGTKICSVPLDEGQTCLTAASCKEGLVCAAVVGEDGKRQHSWNIFDTIEKQCTAPKEAGKFCTVSSDCKTGLSCIDYVDANDGSVYSYKDSDGLTHNKFVCSELKSAGDYCAEDSNCKGDLVCALVLDGDSHQVVTPKVRKMLRT